ncbi:hypothetical protein MSP8887_01808 [Marinomonas spartinae]|uniref:DUF1127 domain-containing protein n=1 Tax=Marinomonas spartinae TaxID=1792290 RepID=UPI000808E4FE|nr:DUF1127 domain-containing protein [Marinomonas spartinae]SBS32874.1 hypothetical protein MSP8887_01808 [Marinomonas spartinae]
MLVIALLAHIKQCVQSYRTRKDLLVLTADELKDVGICEEEKIKQAAKATLLGIGKEVLMFKSTSKPLDKKAHGDV